MVPFNSVAHWLYQCTMRTEQTYSGGLHIWGNHQAGYHQLIAKGGMPGFFNADHLWFEFNINLMAKYVYTYHRSMRVMSVPLITFHSRSCLETKADGRLTSCPSGI